jgi:arylsulfatase A-like enzyme
MGEVEGVPCHTALSGITASSCAARWRRTAAAALLAAAGAPGCAGDAPPRLCILLSVDTLRADRLGAFGSERDLTPRLDALAAESTVFRAAYAPASFTLPSIAALLTGRYPEELGVRNNHAVLGDSVPTLASELAARGWRTHAVVSNWVLRREAGLARGFGRFDDTLPDSEEGRNMPERGAAATTDALLRELDACTGSPGARCFLWGHYQDPHGPYTPPGDLRHRYLERERAVPGARRKLPVRAGTAGIGGIPNYQFLRGRREIAWYRAGYDGEIRHTDEEIGRLLDAVDERGLAEEAVVVFAADHGESLGEDDYWFSHGMLLSDALVRVPLLVRVPGRAPAQRDDVVALVDLFPTLLRLLTGEAPDASLPGRDLLGPDAARQEGRAYLAALGGSKQARHGLVEGPYKLVLTRTSDGWREELHLRGRESVNLAPGDAERTQSLRERLEGLRERYASRATAPARELSARDRERLEALGYSE